jgi:hypothetical protein
MNLDYGREVDAAARQHGLSPEMVAALVMVESSGRADAFRFEPGILAQIQTGKLTPKYLPANTAPRRIASSYGLTQILFVTACDYGFRSEPEALFVPWISLEYGCAHLEALLDRAHGEYEKALCAYNGGWGAVMATPYRNIGYAMRVLAAKDELLKT